MTNLVQTDTADMKKKLTMTTATIVQRGGGGVEIRMLNWKWNGLLVMLCFSVLFSVAVAAAAKNELDAGGGVTTVPLSGYTTSGPGSEILTTTEFGELLEGSRNSCNICVIVIII